MGARRRRPAALVVAGAVLVALGLVGCSEDEPPVGSTEDGGPAAGLQVRPVLEMLPDLGCSTGEEP